MNKRDWKRIGIVVGVIALFILILLSVFHLEHESEEVIIDDRNPQTEPEEEIVFENNSDYTEEEIRDITENLRSSLKDLLTNIEYYKISDINVLILQKMTKITWCYQKRFLRVYVG